MAKWFYARNDERLGPVTKEEIDALLKTGELHPHSGLVWREGLADWVKPASLPELQTPTTTNLVASHNTKPSTDPYAPPLSQVETISPLQEDEDLPDIIAGTHPLGTSEIIGRGFELTKRYFGIVLGALAIVIGISLAFDFIQSGVEGLATYLERSGGNGRLMQTLSFLAIALGITQQLVDLFLALGMIRFGLNFVSGRRADMKMIFGEGDKLLRMIGASILYGLMVGLGLLLLIAPGIYFGLKYSQYQYAIVDRNMGVMESFSYSAKLTSGNLWQLLGLCVLCILINLLGAVVLCVGLIFTIPLTYVITWLCYRWLQKGPLALENRGLLKLHPQANY